MKVYIKTLWGDDTRHLWANETQRDSLRTYLNHEGFYVVTGAGDSLEVYAINYMEPIDIVISKNILAKLQNLWYAYIKGAK
jgi:hypothetical protein